MSTTPAKGKHARTKRTRDYECEDLVKKEHWMTITEVGQLKECLEAWMRDMKAWGGDVRDDIIRLEAAVGAAPGEPGDPPPAPRE